MTRRMLALFAPSMLAAQRLLEPRANQLREPATETGKYFVTFPNANGCFVDPIPVQAKDRLEALLKCGVTVWSEAEWDAAMRHKELKEMAQKHRCVSKERRNHHGEGATQLEAIQNARRRM